MIFHRRKRLKFFKTFDYSLYINKYTKKSKKNIIYKKKKKKKNKLIFLIKKKNFKKSN
jgi:hypothetical protein